MTGGPPPSSPLWLHLRPRGGWRDGPGSAWAIVQAIGSRTVDDPYGSPVQMVDLLLAIADPQGAALLRRALQSHVYGGDDQPPVAMTLRRRRDGSRQEVDLSRHLRKHPLVIRRRGGSGYTALLIVPACTDPSCRDLCDQVMVVAQDQRGLLRNAWRRLMARSSLPLHPSWEGPIMAHLQEVSRSWSRPGTPPLEFLECEGPLQAAYLSTYAAVGEVEKLCKERKLPVPTE